MKGQLRFVPLVVFLTSFSLLCYEIILVRIFSIIQWQNLSALIIGLALLGVGASGTFLAILRSPMEKRFTLCLLGSLILFPVTLCLGFIFSCKIPLNPFEVGIDPYQWIYLFSYFAALGIPFFFAATVIGMALSHYPIGRTYFLNLAGSGVGALAVVLLSFFLHPYLILAAVNGIAFAGAVLFSVNFGRRVLASILLFSLLFAVGFYLSFDWLKLRQMSPYKSLSRTLLLPGARIVAERYSPLGLVQAVEAEGLHYSGDLSLLCPYQVPVQKAIFYDGDSMSAVIPWDGEWEKVGYLDYLPSSLPYHLLPREARQRALIVGVGGGEGILKALFHGFASVEGVEINGDVIRLMRNEMAEFSGRIYDHPRVRIFEKEARGFLSSTTQKYDLIEVSLTESYAAASSGIYAMNETYLYTVESMEEFIRHLNQGGLLAITRWNQSPPRGTIKMLNLCIAALERLQVRDISRHLFFIRSMRVSTLVVSKTPLTTSQIRLGKAFSEARLFDLVHYPGMKAEEANRHIRSDFPIDYEAARSLLSQDRQSFIESYPFEISAPTDSRPYYHDFFKGKGLPLLLQAGPQRIPFSEWGHFVLLICLIIAVTVSFLLILLPLFFSRVGKGSPNFSVFLYFALIGIGYFFIELPFIQRFILFLHHPTYSLSVIISSLLLFSGLGSYYSDRIFPPRYRIFLCALILIGILVIYGLFLNPLLTWMIPRSDPFRILLSVTVSHATGFLHGHSLSPGAIGGEGNG